MEKFDLISILHGLTQTERCLCDCLSHYDAKRAVALCEARARYRETLCDIEDLDVLFFKVKAQISGKPRLSLYLNAFLEKDRCMIKEMAAQIDEEIDELKALECKED